MDMSSLPQIVNSLELGLLKNLTIVDGIGLSDCHMPSFPPSIPALILGLESQNLSHLLTVLLPVYSQYIPVKILNIESVVKEIIITDLGVL